MRRLLIIGLLLLIPVVVYAGVELSGVELSGVEVGGTADFPYGKLYDADFTDMDVDNAEFARGSNIISNTTTRDATSPATYYDANGVMQVSTTSNVPIATGGFYDETGWHARPGLLCAVASTNLMVNSLHSANLTLSDGIDSDYVNYAGAKYQIYVDTSEAHTVNSLVTDSVLHGGKSLKLAISAGGTSIDDVQIFNGSAAAISITSGTVYAVSFFVKTSEAKTIALACMKNTTPYTNYGLSTTFTTVANTWIRVIKTFTANTDASDARIDIRAGNVGAYDLYVQGMQVEALPFASPLIPTTTAALTRNGDVNLAPIAGNRNANEETIFFKFTPFGTYANDGIQRNLCTTSVKARTVTKTSTGTVIAFYPNSTDSASCVSQATGVSPASGTSYVYAGTVQHSSPYTSSYLDGVFKSSETADNFTDNAWTNYTYIGCGGSGTQQLNGIIEHIQIYNRALSQDEVESVTERM